MKKNLQFFFVNGRPVNPISGVVRIFNEIYRRFNTNGKYFSVLNIEMPNSEFDFNLSPDKRDIIFKDEKRMQKYVKQNLENLHEKENSYLK